MPAYQISPSECNSAPAGHDCNPVGMAASSAGVMGPPQAPPRDLHVEQAAWSERAGLLADWTLAKVAVRTDCYGSYWRKPTAGGIEIEFNTTHDFLTRDRLIRHFGGEAPEDRVGVHVVSPTDERCKVTIVDIDAHGPEDDPEANWAFTKSVACRAIERGVEVAVFDSNGAGGFHIWAFHRRPIPCVESYRFGKWAVHDWSRHGLRKEPESLPKSLSLTGKRFGQAIRLPGRHHKRAHWTAVWDGVTEDRNLGFLRGAAAIDAILAIGGRQDRTPLSPLVPPDFTLASEILAMVVRDRRVDPDDLDRDAALAHQALGFLGRQYYEDYDRWVQVGMALRQLGDQGLALWHEWSSQSRSRYRPADLDEKWKTFESPTDSPLGHFANRPLMLGLGSLFAWAKANGWKPPEKKAESTRRGSQRRLRFTVDL
jgi:Primase C terminal 2 (PriCT-2)